MYQHLQHLAQRSSRSQRLFRHQGVQGWCQLVAERWGRCGHRSRASNSISILIFPKIYFVTRHLDMRLLASLDTNRNIIVATVLYIVPTFLLVDALKPSCERSFDASECLVVIKDRGPLFCIWYWYVFVFFILCRLQLLIPVPCNAQSHQTRDGLLSCHRYSLIGALGFMERDSHIGASVCVCASNDARCTPWKTANDKGVHLFKNVHMASSRASRHPSAARPWRLASVWPGAFYSYLSLTVDPTCNI